MGANKKPPGESRGVPENLLLSHEVKTVGMKLATARGDRPGPARPRGFGCLGHPFMAKEVIHEKGPVLHILRRNTGGIHYVLKPKCLLSDLENKVALGASHRHWKSSRLWLKLIFSMPTKGKLGQAFWQVILAALRRGHLPLFAGGLLVGLDG